MKFPEVTPPAHPYLAAITINPEDVARFLRLAGDSPDIQVQRIDQTTPSRWTIHAACASKTGRDALESEW